MTYDLIQTDSGIEIKDGDKTVTKTKSWPPRNPETIETLLDNAGFDEGEKSALKIMLGVADIGDE